MRFEMNVFAAVALSAVCVGGRASAEGFFLAKESKPLVEIVYANTPSDYPTPPAEQTARFDESLKDFCEILKRLSGAEFTARSAADVGEKDPVGTIQIGLTPAAIRAGLAEKVKTLPPHSLVIHADLEKHVLYLLGSTLEGSSHAMYEFLEHLGCRWFMPGAFGEELPSLTTVQITDLDRVREPAFEVRTIQLGAVGSVKIGSPTRKEFADWMRRNKFGGWQPPRGHSFPTLVPEKEYFKEHPEYYALRNGARTPSHLCMTQPGTLVAAEKHLVEYFTQNPTARGFPVALTDGIQYCECPACTKSCGGDPKHIVNLYLTFTRELFDRVDKHFPGREFQYGVYVYANLLDFPEVEVPRQLAPFMAPLGEDCIHEIADPALYMTLSAAKDFPESTLKRIKEGPRSESAQFVQRLTAAWGKGTKNIYMRDYDPYMTFGQNMPLVRMYQLGIEIPWYKSIGVRGFTPEAVANSWFSSGLNFYVRSRLYWDIHADMKALMQDYCKGMFGKASEPMYWFLDALARRTIETTEFRHGDESLTRLYPIEWVRGLDTYLGKAEALATTEKEKARVNMWRLCQRHMLKYLETRNAEIDGDFTKAARLGHEYVQLLDEIHAVNPHFVENKWYEGREFNMAERTRQYEQLASLLDGREGSLVLRLPPQWQFKYDPQDVGMTERWYAFDPTPATSGPASGWTLQLTQESWQTREEQYKGYNWYRTQAFVPEDARGKEIRLLVGGLFGHMDFFVNGQRVTWPAKGLDAAGHLALRQVAHLDMAEAWSWNYDRVFDVDISTYLNYGKDNTFAFRTKDKKQWGGIFKNATLFSALKKRLPVYDPFIPRPPLDAEASPAEIAAIEKILKKVTPCDCSQAARDGR